MFYDRLFASNLRWVNKPTSRGRRESVGARLTVYETSVL